MSLAPGEVFAGYTVVRLLGSGGMGEVYLVRHPRLPRQDALKVLPSSVSADAEFRERFNREADLAATLWHPHIVGVHDRGEYEGRLWIAMDYVEGTDAARLSRGKYPSGMPASEVVEIVTAVAEALDYAHERQLLHRDVKPANILLSDTSGERRRILLADFGIARHSDDAAGLTATDMTIGSVSYTAPEQLMGEAIDGRSDQYSLAATAFHLLTGSPPFPHTNPAVVITRHLNAPPPLVSDGKSEMPGFDPVLSTALSKNRDGRYHTCLDFAAALAEAAPDAPQPAATTHFAVPPVITASARPAEPTTDLSGAQFEPTVQHSVPPPVVVSDWAGAQQPVTPAQPVSPPPTPPPPSPLRLDPLVVIVAVIAGIALVALLTYVLLDSL
jgi:serine/threonine-protein kinase